MLEHERALCGDSFARDEINKLVNTFNITDIIETGTFRGKTTTFFSSLVNKVITFEINQERFSNCANLFANLNLHNITIINESSSTNLLQNLISNEINKSALYFLDAHSPGNCPLLNELSQIASYTSTPVIVIHDFKVPNSSLRFDVYNGQPLEFNWIKSSLDTIYGIDNYNYYYNSDITATGKKRGIIYITPLI